MDEQGSEFYRIYVKNLADGSVLEHPVESANGDFEFTPDSQYIFWVWRDENARPTKVYRRLARGSEDTLVFAEADEGMFVGLGKTSDDSHMLIEVANQETSEVLILAASEPLAAFVVVEPRVVGVLYELDHWTDRWVIRTNADDAIDFKLCVSQAEMPSKATWQPWLPHSPGRYLHGNVCVCAQYVVRAERVNALDRLVIMPRDGPERVIAFDEEAYDVTMNSLLEYHTTTFRFVYESPTTPKQTYDYDLASHERVLRKVQQVPSGHEPSRYTVRRLFARATDGVLVPVTVLMLKSTPLDGSAPLFLYGYGSYGFSVDPTFSTSRLSLVNRGWVFALAHVRGGSEMGRGWFYDGRKEKKPNTFTDFIACAEYLIAERYTTRGRIAASGASAGGMLMGAVANLRPDLWGAVVAGVPFVDVLTTMSDTTLPLTPPEWPEWGNPLESPAAYDLMASYSPYDQIAARPYPPILATGGLTDPRVTYWEPMKWVAKLRVHTTSGAPVALKINMDAGHSGASGRFDYLKEIALDYAFALWAIEPQWRWAAPQ